MQSFRSVVFHYYESNLEVQLILNFLLTNLELLSFINTVVKKELIWQN